MRPATSATPGSGCAAIDGLNAGHAILGTSDHCVATHPSDLAVALVALDATMRVRGPGGRAQLPGRESSSACRATPRISNTRCCRGELIVEVRVPGGPHARRARYLKVRDRASYEFALGLGRRGARRRGRRDPRGPDRRRRRRHAALAPARLRGALVGQGAGPAVFRGSRRAGDGGRPAASHNHYKVELLPRTIVRALEMAGEVA